MNESISRPSRCVFLGITLCFALLSGGCMNSRNPTSGLPVEENSDAVGCHNCLDNQTCVDDACICSEGFSDCDGILINGCETQGECSCSIGDQRECYYGAPVTEGVGACTSGIETCNGNEWGPCEGQTLPIYELCEPDGIDQDCDGTIDEIEDADGDGFTMCDGDCCDDPMQHCAENPALVNPGAFDVAGNELDDDCDGVIDNEPATDCSETMVLDAATGSDLIMAMDLCQFTGDDPHKWGVIESITSNISGTSSPLEIQTSVLEGFSAGSMPTRKNSTLTVLSSGDARGVEDPGYTEDISDGVYAEQSGPEDYLLAHNNELVTADGCAVPDATFYDTVKVSAKIRVPTNAMGFQFEFRFFSYEYPQFICTEFNDFFLAMLTSEHSDIPEDKNISFDAAGNPVSVNNAFFTTCEPMTCQEPGTVYDAYSGYGDEDGDGCPGTLTCNEETDLCETSLGACPDGPEELLNFSTRTDNSGATSWLTTSAPVVPGEEITLEFLIWDTGDSSMDSLVLLDNFQWLLEPTELATKN
jgi:hypothetical protein